MHRHIHLYMRTSVRMFACMYGYTDVMYVKYVMDVMYVCLSVCLYGWMDRYVDIHVYIDIHMLYPCSLGCGRLCLAPSQLQALLQARVLDLERPPGITILHPTVDS